jgi:hypothetical protein
VSLDDDERWTAVAAGGPAACATWLRARLTEPGYADITAVDLASAGDCSSEEAEALLERATVAGFVIRVVVTSCPCCNEVLSPEDAADDSGVCPHCNQAFVDCDSGVLRTVHYSREAEPGRSVPWVLVLHGMNTRGGWQEELSWLIATTYGRSVPVFIYKYGRVLSGVLLGRRRRSLMLELARRIRDLSGERHGDRLGPRPDVIAHSFGTWMLGHALASTDPELADLAVGRIVLLGCILRPRFSWTKVLARGRAEAVLNHYGTADVWAGASGYVIYDSGPSGRRGFDLADGEELQLVINREEPGFRHSSFFNPSTMRDAYVGVWQPFLTEPVSGLTDLERHGPRSPWRPPPRLMRFLAGTVTVSVGTALVALVTVALVLGALRLVTIAAG